jgi:pimeloyl-ACP methyl ester carboxylesterase
MRTERVEVAPGVELAVDRWPAAGSEDHSHDGGTRPAGGPRPAVMLLHGLASNARMWDGVAASLTRAGHDVVTVDLRGHGRSSKPDADYAVPTVAHDVAVLIERLGLDRPVVAGQSWGGNVVVELAAGHAGATRGIVCVDGGWIDVQAQFADWEACRSALAPPRLVGRPRADFERRFRSSHPDWPETGIQGAFANFEVRDDGTIAPWLTFDRHIAVLRGLWEHRPATRYAAIAVSALLIPADPGERSRTARTQNDVAAAAAAIPRARVCWLDGEHDLHAQHPDQVASLIDEATKDGLFADDRA